MKVIGLDEQTGFTKEKGCQHGQAALMAMLRKRSEHNKDTWVLFIDLVKAFDTVNRDCLIDVLAKLGVPPNLVQIIGVMHEKVMVKFEVGDATKEFPSTVGVKQGDNLAPVLFVMFMQVVMETVMKKWPAGGFLTYKAKQDGVLHGRDCKTEGDDFDFSSSLYADDAAATFDSREALAEGTETLHQHFVLFGMLMHVGRDGAKSKTEAMFCPAGRRDKSAKIEDDASTRLENIYSAADTSPITVDGNGCVHFCKLFKYLGSFISWDLNDEHEVMDRIQKASRSFGAMNCVFRARNIRYIVKNRLYITLVCSILLYGSENWCLTQKVMKKLQNFHAECCRAMSNVSMYRTWKRRISTRAINERLGLPDILTIIGQRNMAWLGKMARMPFTCQIRRLLTGYLDSSRRVGSPRMTFGRTFVARYAAMLLAHPAMDRMPSVREAIANSMGLYKGVNDDTEYISWYDIALDRKLWEMLTQLMSSENLSFKLKDLEEPVAELKSKRDDYCKREAEARAAEYNLKLAGLVIPPPPPRHQSTPTPIAPDCVRRSARTRQRSNAGKKSDEGDYQAKLAKWSRKRNAVIKKKELLMKQRRKARSKETEVILSTMIKVRIEKFSSRVWKTKQRKKAAGGAGADAMCTVS